MRWALYRGTAYSAAPLLSTRPLRPAWRNGMVAAMPAAAAAAASSAAPHLARNRPLRRPICSINMACTAACSVGAPRPAAALRCQRATRVQRAARLVTRAAAGDVLLEVHDLQAKIAATGQQILKGVTLTGECASLAAPGSHAVCSGMRGAARRPSRSAAAGGRVGGGGRQWRHCRAERFHCPCPRLQCGRARCMPSWARTAPARARSPRCAGWLGGGRGVARVGQCRMAEVPAVGCCHIPS